MGRFVDSLPVFRLGGLLLLLESNQRFVDIRYNDIDYLRLLRQSHCQLVKNSFLTRLAMRSESWCAKATLRTTKFRKTGLNRFQVSTVCQSFDSYNFTLVDLSCQAEARESRFTIYQDAATTTGT